MSEFLSWDNVKPVIEIEGVKMEYKQRQYPLFSACGLNCGLCPRYHTDGISKCPGCAGEDFSSKHPACGVLSCSQRHEIEYCCLCDEYPCKKFEGVDNADSFITHKNQLADFDKVKNIGLAAFKAELNIKVELLKGFLMNFDDGRRKSFFCIAVNLLNLQDLKRVMEQLKDEIKPGDTLKERSEAAARLLQTMAKKRDVSLQLRKKPKP